MKRFISLLLFVTILLMAGSFTTADSNGPISYELAKIRLLKDNSDLEQLRVNVFKAEKGYEDSLENAKDINIEYLKFLGFDENQIMQMTKGKEYTPLAAKYNLYNAQSRQSITHNQLVLSLRDIYLGLYNAEMNVKLSQQQYDKAIENHNRNIEKKKHGNISTLDFSESEYNLEKAKKNLEAAFRSRQNTLRNFNFFIGEPIDTTYDYAILEEKLSTTELKTVSYYVEQALKNRNDYRSIVNDLELKKLEADIMAREGANELYRYTIKDYGLLLNNIKSAEIQVDQKQYSIRQEIEQAYIDIKNQRNSITRMEKTIELQKKSLARTKMQYDQGKVAKASLEDAEQAVNDLENNLLTMIYTYNTKLMKLEYATGIGPSY